MNKFGTRLRSLQRLFLHRREPVVASSLGSKRYVRTTRFNELRRSGTLRSRNVSAVVRLSATSSSSSSSCETPFVVNCPILGSLYYFLFFLSPPEGGLDLVSNRQGIFFSEPPPREGIGVGCTKTRPRTHF